MWRGAHRKDNVLKLDVGRVSLFVCLFALLTMLSSCQQMGSSWSSPAATSLSMHGTVHGGQQPVSGSAIRLYTAGTTGGGSAAHPLIEETVQTDGSGGFSISGPYTCPSPNAEVYVVAKGGNPALSANISNSAIALMALLGPCNRLNSISFVSIDEVTTVGSVWPVSSYMTSLSGLGSSPGDSAFAAAVSRVNELIDVVRGVSPGVAVPEGYLVQTGKLYVLADILATCVNSSGGVAGDGSACGNLFSVVTGAGEAAPTDTVGAALRIARYPGANTGPLFSLVPPTALFQPTLAAAPHDWSLDLLSVPSAPGTFPSSGGQQAGNGPILPSSATPAITLALPNSSIVIGSVLIGTVNLADASANDIAISLSSTSPSLVSVKPSALNLPAGQTTGSFTYSGHVVGMSTLSASAPGYLPASAPVTVALPSVPASFLGLTVLDLTHRTPSMQFGTTRSWDAHPNLDWSDANPSAGIYDLTGFDKFIAVNQTRGTEMIYTLGRTPQWASSQPNAATHYGPGGCAPAADIKNYDSYLRTVVTQAAGRIKYWELWNEPQDLESYCGGMREMVTMAQHAAQIIKKIDPTALILSPGVTGGSGPAWLSSFLSQGGALYIDVIAFHGYSSATAEDVVNVISSYKTVMAANGVAGKPLWDTEASWSGFGNIGTPSSSQQVAFIAKDFLLHWSGGVERFVWYAYDGGSIWGGLWNSTTSESPAAISFRETYRWMVGATLTAPCSESKGGVWTCIFSRPGGYMAEAVWISSKTATFSVPGQFTQYRDLAGEVHPVTSQTVTVGDLPILFETGTPP